MCIPCLGHFSPLPPAPSFSSHPLKIYFFKCHSELGVMVHVYNPSTLEAEAGRSWVPSQPGLHSEFKVSLSHHTQCYQVFQSKKKSFHCFLLHRDSSKKCGCCSLILVDWLIRNAWDSTCFGLFQILEYLHVYDKNILGVRPKSKRPNLKIIYVS
jgi:hypothetical protein